MKCPNCAVEQPGTNQECPGCQLNFAKYNEAQYKRQQALPAAASPASAAPEEGLSPWVITLALALACGAVWLVVSPKKGLPVPDGSTRNEKFQFSITVPPEWKAETSGKTEGKMSEAMTLARGWGPGEPASALTIVSIAQSLPEIKEADKAEALDSIKGELKKQFDEFKIEDASVVMVDNLSSLRIVASSKKTIEVAAAVYGNMFGGPYTGGPGRVLVRPPETRTFDLKTIFYLVPGADRGYLLMALIEAGRYSEVKKDLESAFDSFRVLERPWPYSRFFRFLNKQITSTLLIALALGYFRWIFGR